MLKKYCDSLYTTRGGFQYRFRDFDESWIAITKRLDEIKFPNAETFDKTKLLGIIEEINKK